MPALYSYLALRMLIDPANANAEPKNSMRAIRIHETGGPDVLRWEDVALAAPAATEVQIRHTAVGVNFIDTYHRSGLYPLAKLPSALGQEAAGVIEAIGAEVEGLSVGDRVAYASAGTPGSYAEARNAPAERVIPLPDDIPEEVAAASLLKGMTVAYLLRETYPVRPGQTVLFHAAAGGVGLIACQWLRHLGVEVIGTVGSAKKAELARAHGCTHPIVYTEEDFTEEVRRLTNSAGVPVVFDSVGRATFDGSLDCLTRRGMLVSFGNASGPPPPLNLGVLARKGSLFVTRPTLFDYIATREALLATAHALFDVIAAGHVRIDIHQRFALERAADAHRALESRQTVGATILTPG